MLGLTNPIKARLQGADVLPAWAVRSGREMVTREHMPAVHLRCAGGPALPTRNTAAQLSPAWVVTLVVKASDESADQLDAAIAAVIQALHNWKPLPIAGRGWEPLRLSGAIEAELAPEGAAAYELTFTTSALYTGQD